MVREINDNNIAQAAESLLFYEKYEPVLEYLQRKKELWVSDENYLQLSEVPADEKHNPEFVQFRRYLSEKSIPFSTDRNNHIHLCACGRAYVIWPYTTEMRIEKWCIEGIPITYYYTEIRKHYVIVVDEANSRAKMNAQEAIKRIFEETV